MAEKRDPGLEALLPLDGEVFFVDADGKHYVKFAVKSVPASPERPHGLSYSLTLHDETGERLVSRTRSSHGCSAGTFANFGSKGTLES